MFSIRNGSLAWAHNTELILCNVNLDIAKGKITVLTGSVGSGKSPLLKVLLGELVCLENWYAVKAPFSPPSQRQRFATRRLGSLGVQSGTI